jgi:hypothetical protein
MSVHVSSWAWRQRVGDDGAKLVLLKLADSANDDGVAWPKRRTLLEECEAGGEATVKRRLKKLRDLELVIVVPWFDPSGRQTSSMYVLPHAGVPAGLELVELLAKAEREGHAGELIELPRGRGSSVTPSPPVTPTRGSSVTPTRGSSVTPSIEDPSEDPKEDPRAGSAGKPAQRERDLVWDTLEELFGSLGTGKSNARSKRNRAVSDLKAFGATPASIRAAFDAYPRLMPAGTRVTDTALATHYPQLAHELGVVAGEVTKRSAPCGECGVGGGLHTAGCPLASAA